MKDVLVIGSGIAGLSCAVSAARLGITVVLVSPFPSERAQSVMAAGGINAVGRIHEEGDSVEAHISDTLKGGGFIAGEKSVTGLCSHAGEILDYLKNIGTVFSVDDEGNPVRRAFGGQSYKRTYYCGSSTGKQIVTALVMEARSFEAKGIIKRRLWSCFHSALIENGVCHGAIIFDEHTMQLEAVYADALVIATGGQNAVFGKTTGSTSCDGYAVGKLFMQGAVLKNLEFIQYHPTTLETSQKKMLISEAVRGEGGRLFYLENGQRVYFLEDKYGPKGNLLTRDVISREILKTGKDVFLDISFLGKDKIDSKLPEVRDLCLKYRGIDITKEPIPVTPSVHFFMGGLAVHLNHETNIRNLFAIGECASMYHGANRLGGNSLLAAMYSGQVAAKEIAQRNEKVIHPDFKEALESERELLKEMLNTKSSFSVMHIRDMLSQLMQKNLGIVRSKKNLEEGMKDLRYIAGIAGKIQYDSSVLPYFNYSLMGILTLSEAILRCAEFRKESRGSHYRTDYPETDKDYEYATLISFDRGEFSIRLDKEHEYES